MQTNASTGETNANLCETYAKRNAQPAAIPTQVTYCNPD